MNSLVGTGSLIRLALRRSRVLLTAWVLGVSLVVISVASSFAKLYPDAQSRADLAATVVHTPSFLALTGPAFDLTTIGGLTAWRFGGIAAVMVALLSVFTMTRHTRAEEESGRLELVGSGVVGRRAALTAAVLVVLLANLVTALLTTLGLMSLGLPTAGCFALGLAIGSAGFAFGSIAAVAAQLTENPRTANGLSITILGLAFLLRAAGDSAGDTGPKWLSWLSPIGWAQQVRPFADERWWVFGLPAALTVVLVVAAYAIVGNRDIGAGLLPQRRGPATASAGLSGPIGLAWRLHRGSLLGWVVGFAVVGLIFGGLANSVTDILNTSAQLAQILAAMGGKQALVDSFFSAVMGLVGLVAAAYGVQAALRMRAEETSLRAEPVLAGAVGRIRWAASHLLFALLGTALLLLAAGTVAGLAYGAQMGDIGTQLPRTLAGAVVQLPAAWVLVGVTVTLFGLLPRFVTLGWVAVVISLLLGQFGPLLQLSQWALDVSPFTHVPKLPGGDFTATPIVWLLAVTVVLTSAGLVGFRRRDIG